ncbi:hypothetical protein [Nonomuraea rhizosphaerae]|uniref:hypothetical protein n=1 Tax=Nonomuraea rhizosphaerae TaxID=2665663 RepID=UPI001C5FDA8A|nr:hypothetical protein [Nonomuraea rhizosphaerae]
MTETPRPPEAGDRLVAASSRPAPATTTGEPEKTAVPQAPSQAPAVPFDQPRPHRAALPRQVTGPVRVWRGVVAFLAGAVRLASRLAALVLVLYAVFTVFKANPANIWYQFVESLASSLSLGLANLFELSDLRWTTVVNHGLAALVWLAVGSAVAGLIRRAAP